MLFHLLLLCYTISCISAYTCTLSWFGSLTTFGGYYFQVPISNSESDLFNPCNIQSLNVHLNADNNSVTFSCGGSSDRITAGNQVTSGDTTVSIGSDGTIIVSVDTATPVSSFCGLCNVTSQNLTF